MKYDHFENDTYNLYTIETQKFKSVHMEVVFRTPVNKENITYLALLSDVLMENSKAYPSKKMLTRKLYDLYNANIYASNSRVGNMLITNFIIDFLDPKYTNKDCLENSIALLFEMIFNPNVENGVFDEKTFERVKSRLHREIDSLKEDPKQSSILEAFKKIDPMDTRSFNASGEAEILESITPKKLYSFYEEFLERSARDIYVVGNLDMKSLDKTIKKYAKFKSIPVADEELYLKEYKKISCKNASRSSELSQTNLVQIYSLSGLTMYEEDYVVPLFNMLWGSGSLESKLYKSLRADNSLCYNVSTFYQKYDRVIVLHTAIDEENSGLTMKLIKNALYEMSKGYIQEEELENVKNILTTSLNLILDNPNRLVDMYLFKNIAGLKDIETRIEEIKKVTLEDIVGVAKKIRLCISYRVRGE